MEIINPICCFRKILWLLVSLDRQDKTWGNIRKNGGGPGPGPETGRERGAAVWREEEREVKTEIAPGPMRGRNRREVSEIETRRGGDPDPDHVTDTRRVRKGLGDIPPVSQTAGQTPTPSAPTTPLYSSPSWS